MRERLRKAAPYLGYSAFFFGCFFLFAYFTFPYDRLRDYLVHKIEYRTLPGGRLEPTGYHVTMVDMSPYWLSGVQIQGLRVITQPTTPREVATDTTIPRLTARVSLLPLLIGKLKASYDIEIPGGRIEGTFATNSSRSYTEIDTRFERVNLRALPILRAATSMPMRGVLNGRIELDAPAERNSAQGVIELTLQRFEVGDSHSQMPLPGVPAGVVIEPIRAGDAQVRIDIARGEGTVRRFDARGPDVEMTGSGTIHVQSPIQTSRVDLLLRARFSDEYKQKSDVTRTMFTMLEASPMLRQARSPDGWLQVRLRGSAAVRFVPTPAGDERPPARR